MGRPIQTDVGRLRVVVLEIIAKYRRHQGLTVRAICDELLDAITRDDRDREMNSTQADAAALGRRGGKLGGPARARKMTPEERSESARVAALARWDSVRKAQAENVQSLVPRVYPSADALEATLARIKNKKRPSPAPKKRGKR